MNTFILAAIGVFLMAQTVFGAEAKSVCDGKILYMISMTPTGVKQIDTLRPAFRALGLSVPQTEDAAASARRAGVSMRSIDKSMIEVTKSFDESDLQCARLGQAQVQASGATFGVELPELIIKNSDNDRYGHSISLYWDEGASNLINQKQHSYENTSY